MRPTARFSTHRSRRHFLRVAEEILPGTHVGRLRRGFHGGMDMRARIGVVDIRKSFADALWQGISLARPDVFLIGRSLHPLGQVRSRGDRSAGMLEIDLYERSL